MATKKLDSLFQKFKDLDNQIKSIDTQVPVNNIVAEQAPVKKVAIVSQPQKKIIIQDGPPPGQSPIESQPQSQTEPLALTQPPTQAQPQVQPPTPTQAQTSEWQPKLLSIPPQSVVETKKKTATNNKLPKRRWREKKGQNFKKAVKNKNKQKKNINKNKMFVTARNRRSWNKNKNYTPKPKPKPTPRLKPKSIQRPKPKAIVQSEISFVNEIMKSLRSPNPQPIKSKPKSQFKAKSIKPKTPKYKTPRGKTPKRRSFHPHKTPIKYRKRVPPTPKKISVSKFRNYHRPSKTPRRHTSVRVRPKTKLNASRFSNRAKTPQLPRITHRIIQEELVLPKALLQAQEEKKRGLQLSQMVNETIKLQDQNQQIFGMEEPKQVSSTQNNFTIGQSGDEKLTYSWNGECWVLS